ncbi:uncharacterized protein TNCV_3651141 [Trichonephila clavipes]|nr:uncharacterized protein TNCV_3651141 [Trichonephila clavipes]
MPNCRRWPRGFAISLNAGSALVENLATCLACLHPAQRPERIPSPPIGRDNVTILLNLNKVSPAEPHRPAEPERILTPPAQRLERVPTYTCSLQKPSEVIELETIYAVNIIDLMMEILPYDPHDVPWFEVFSFFEPADLDSEFVEQEAAKGKAPLSSLMYSIHASPNCTVWCTKAWRRYGAQTLTTWTRLAQAVLDGCFGQKWPDCVFKCQTRVRFASACTGRKRRSVVMHFTCVASSDTWMHLHKHSNDPVCCPECLEPMTLGHFYYKHAPKTHTLDSRKQCIFVLDFDNGITGKNLYVNVNHIVSCLKLS